MKDIYEKFAYDYDEFGDIKNYYQKLDLTRCIFMEIIVEIHLQKTADD